MFGEFQVLDGEAVVTLHADPDDDHDCIQVQAAVSLFGELKVITVKPTLVAQWSKLVHTIWIQTLKKGELISVVYTNPNGAATWTFDGREMRIINQYTLTNPPVMQRLHKAKTVSPG